MSDAKIKLTKYRHPRVVSTGFDAGLIEVDGFAFTFPDYPQIPLFVFKHPRIGNYHVREMRTGLKAGTEYGEKTRAGAIEKQRECFERMRNAPNGKGRHSYVVDLVEKCVAVELEKRQSVTPAETMKKEGGL